MTISLEVLNKIDVISPVWNDLVSGHYKLDRDGKIRIMVSGGFMADSPWINLKVAEDRCCSKWIMIYFSKYRFISRNCYNCWKIVVRPRNLEELMQIYELQKKQVVQDGSLPCKCGIERRSSYTGKFYGAFWYNSLGCSMEEAQENHKRIAYAVRSVLPITTKVVLKRGCTEFEEYFGPSDKWNYPEELHAYEDLLDSVWDVPSVDLVEPLVLRTHRFKMWIQWALEHGDETAAKYLQGPLENTRIHTVVYNDKKVQLVSLPETAAERRRAQDESTEEPKIALLQ